MKILVLGGTQFVGRHIVEALLRAGHSVSILNRGRSTDDLPIQVERLCGDRDHGPSGVEALTARIWDVCVDVSGYTARQVQSSAEKLRRNVGRYVFVSAVSVCGDPRSSLMHVSNERAVAAGLTLTDPAITVRDVRIWLCGKDQSPALSPEREAAFIEMSRSS